MRLRFLSFGVIVLLTLCMSPPAWGLELKGYADITYTQSSSDRDSIEENGAFAIGEFDLFMTHLIHDRIDVLAELVIELDSKGESFFVDLERLQVGYASS